MSDERIGHRHPTNGHLFDPDLRCRMCGISWELDQELGEQCLYTLQRPPRHCGRPRVNDLVAADIDAANHAVDLDPLAASEAGVNPE